MRPEQVINAVQNKAKEVALGKILNYGTELFGDLKGLYRNDLGNISLTLQFHYVSEHSMTPYENSLLREVLLESLKAFYREDDDTKERIYLKPKGGYIRIKLNLHRVNSEQDLVRVKQANNLYFDPSKL